MQNKQKIMLNISLFRSAVAIVLNDKLIMKCFREKIGQTYFYILKIAHAVTTNNWAIVSIFILYEISKYIYIYTVLYFIYHCLLFLLYWKNLFNLATNPHGGLSHPSWDDIAMWKILYIYTIPITDTKVINTGKERSCSQCIYP